MALRRKTRPVSSPVINHVVEIRRYRKTWPGSWRKLNRAKAKRGKFDESLVMFLG
jgi:hypothetical protein